MLQATRKAHWKRVWDSAKRIFKSSSGEAGSTAGSNGPNDVELQLSLAQLHMSIQDSMAAEVWVRDLAVSLRLLSLLSNYRPAPRQALRMY